MPFRFLPVFSLILGIREVYGRAPTRPPWPPEYFNVFYVPIAFPDTDILSLKHSISYDNQFSETKAFLCTLGSIERVKTRER